MDAGKAWRDLRLCWTSLQQLRADSPELPPFSTAEQPAQPYPARQRCGAALRLGKSGIPWDTWGSAWSLIPSPGNLLLAPRSAGVTHVLSLAPGDALLPWAGSDPQQRRRGTPAGERPGDPPLPRPPAPGRWGRRWGRASDTREMGTAWAAAGRVRRGGGIWGLHVPPRIHRETGAAGSHGRDENRERPWSLQSCG